jgi:hypothetical protein
LLEAPKSGVMLQSEIDPDMFLNGNYIVTIYGNSE